MGCGTFAGGTFAMLKPLTLMRLVRNGDNTERRCARRNERPYIRAVAVAATTKLPLLGLRYPVTPIMSATYSDWRLPNAIRGVASDFHCRVTPYVGCTNEVVITRSSTPHCRMTTR